MLLLTGADVVLADRIVSPGTVVIESDRITEVREGTVAGGGAETRVDLPGRYLVPGFIDVHVHGIEGHDTLDGPGAVTRIAERLARHGVTAFCPTSVACPPGALRAFLDQVREARIGGRRASARVLPAHLESNFISNEYRGAQPADCLRLPPSATDRRGNPPADSAAFDAEDILREIDRAVPDVGIVTLAPELDGAGDLVRRLVDKGITVSLGHSGADFECGMAAIEAGATHATHLFNRMPPLGHRAPGLAGAILASDRVAAEIVCDGHHVHPAMVRVAVAAKGIGRVMAITDGTAGAGLPVGTRAVLGGRPITVRSSAAYLDDGTLAGSVLTLERAFAVLVGLVGVSVVEAATLCATTPARHLGLHGHGVIAPGAVADLVVMDRDFRVEQTYVGGELAFAA